MATALLKPSPSATGAVRKLLRFYHSRRNMPIAELVLTRAIAWPILSSRTQVSPGAHPDFLNPGT